MEEFLPALQKSSLFGGIDAKDILDILSHTGYTLRNYKKGEVLILSGYEYREIGILLSGEIEAVKQSEGGDVFTISRISKSGIFCDVLSGSRHIKSPVTVSARCNCRAIYIPYNKLFAPLNVQSLAVSRLLQNLVGTISDKYFELDKRLSLVLLKSLRAKILRYLNGLSKKAECREFTVPFTRTAMANYLGCERSALSRELSRMQKDGIINIDKNKFTLL
ncbi:MAG: Crp/Fnr family transcriptional regulator [Oscillospiraceae bacterium]